MPRLEFPNGTMKFKFDKSCPFYASDRKIFKSQASDQFTELFERFNNIVILKISGVETTELQTLRRALSNQDSELYSELYVGKHSLSRVSIDGLIRNLKTKIQNSISSVTKQSSQSRDQELVKALTQFKELLVGEIALLFTNCENYYTLCNEISKHVSLKKAKVGSIIKENVFFEGETGALPYMTYIFLNNNITTRIRRGQVVLLERQQILTAGEVCTAEKVRLLDLLKWKVIQERCEPLYLFSKMDACILSNEVLERDYFENCVEAANQMTALSMECSLVNELTIVADIKKGILDLVALDTETQCEMRYKIRKVMPPPVIDNHCYPSDSSSESSEFNDLFDLFF
ncbi:hypothetical protein C9374_013169 [Naegleria lovaniensis]|uniref:Large ribosomal subunit protein uL10-like insertion domain-containing protein n=1 Tax=Naegleria lovaniensis TaxID=51637 RepID=A0AA88GC58_NAELO|nr:uncharacterized protein C9374_013169 [Naegleria lovaniensis]KAG2372805.1 hypothetical protein C9374_013169 [Naegleria lovaniensis]